MCNVYRRFVDRCAKISGPLADILKKGEPEIFVLNENQRHAFNKLRYFLINPPILTLPKEGKKFTLDVDACDYQICACLLQEQEDGSLQHCGYYSRTLNTAERNYSTPEKECLAVFWGILFLRPYLEIITFLYVQIKSISVGYYRLKTPQDDWHTGNYAYGIRLYHSVSTWN
jgi:RNase H-like domain found in reverse transcriptase